MIIKLASIPFMDRIKDGVKNYAKRVASSEGAHNMLESGMLIPTIAVGDGLMHSTVFHEKGKSRAKEFGVGAFTGGVAGAIIGAGDVGVHHFSEWGKKLART